MTLGPERQELWGTPEFLARMAALTNAAATDPNGRSILKEALKTVEGLEHGTENGHHPLGFTLGNGDLRDCTVSAFRSSPQAKLDHRITWRQLPPQSDGRPPAREIVDIGPRHGTPPYYERQCQILGRTMDHSIEGNDVFGHRAAQSGGNQAARAIALEHQRLVALSRDGMTPLAGSIRLVPSLFGARKSPAAPQRAISMSASRDR